MDTLASYRLTLIFIFAIVAPSTLVSFVSLGAITHERNLARARLAGRCQAKARDVAEAIERRLAEAAAGAERPLSEAASRARGLPELGAAVRALAGAGRPFRAAALVAPGGTVLGDAPAPGSNGDRPLDEILRPAEDLEVRAQDPAAALGKLDEIERAHPDDESVRAEALRARARIRGREEDFPHNANDALRSLDGLIARYPLARDRDGSVISLGARLEIASIWRRFGDDGMAARALEDLVVFIARHEDAIRGAQAEFYRLQAIARLREIEPQAEGRALRRAEVARGDREAARAFAGRLGGAPLAARVRAALEGGAAPSGWLRGDPGRPPVWYRLVGAQEGGRGGGSSPLTGRPILGLAALELDLEALRAEAFEPLLERAAAHDEAALVLGARGAPPAAPADPGAPAPEVVARLALRPPLDDLEIVAWRREADERETLDVLSDRVRTWSIGLALVGLLAGAFVMTRTVRKEMKAAELKSDFVTTVTHELKTPLTSIGMFAETLLMGRVESEDEKRECLEIIAKETDRLTRLIDRVLTFSKIEARRKRFDLKLTDLGKLVEETVELFRTQMRGGKKSFSLEMTITHDLKDVLCDRAALQEVLLNLLSNAYKYGGEQPRIHVTVSKRRHWTSSWAVVDVRDRGMGLKRADQRRIFHKFYRANDLLTRDVEGTGIGLTLAQSIVHAHRGDITVKSKVGAGSTFTVWLPR